MTARTQTPDIKIRSKIDQKYIKLGQFRALFGVIFVLLAKRAQGGSQRASTWFPEDPRRAPRGPQDGQVGAKRAHDGSKMAPGGPQEGPRQPKMAP